MPPWWFNLAFGVIAFVASLFYGLKACDAFGVQGAGRPWAWWLHQFWFNFVGSVVGWAATWFLALKVWPCLSGPCLGSLQFSDGFLGFIAFIGITGHLPYATAGLLEGIKELASKVSGIGK